MNKEYYDYLDALGLDKRKRMEELAGIIEKNIPNISFKIAKYYPTFHIDNSHCIIITFFKDYCNIFAAATFDYKAEIIKHYYMHPKGMIKLMSNDIIDEVLFEKIFVDSIKKI